MRKLLEIVLIVGVMLFMGAGIAIVGAQLVGVATLDGTLIQGAVDLLALYAYIPAAVVSIVAYLLSYGRPRTETHDDA